MGSVTCERRPPIRHVRLDTGRLNVLDVAAVHGLREHLAAVDEEAPVVLLGGRDDALSAGLDLATLASEAYRGAIRAVRSATLARMETLVDQARQRLDVLRARAAESA